MIQFVRKLLPGTPNAVPKDSLEVDRAHVRRIVQHRARGNFRLHLGRYVTEQDLKDQYEHIRDERFSEGRQ